MDRVRVVRAFSSKSHASFRRAVRLVDREVTTAFRTPCEVAALASRATVAACIIEVPARSERSVANGRTRLRPSDGKAKVR